MAQEVLFGDPFKFSVVAAETDTRRGLGRADASHEAADAETMQVRGSVGSSSQSSASPLVGAKLWGLPPCPLHMSYTLRSFPHLAPGRSPCNLSGTASLGGGGVAGGVHVPARPVHRLPETARVGGRCRAQRGNRRGGQPRAQPAAARHPPRGSFPRRPHQRRRSRCGSFEQRRRGGSRGRRRPYFP